MTAEDATLRKTAAMERSVIPTDLRVPIAEMFLKSIIRSEEIILTPATRIISIRTKYTLKSISSIQEKISGYMFRADDATTVSSSSGVLKSTLAPTS